MAGVQQAQWSRYLDEKSGKYYFYNKATRKTVWRRPKGFRRSGSAVSSSSSRNTPRKAQPLRSATGGIEPSLGTGRDSDFAVEGLTRRGSKFNMANPLTAGKATDASTGSSLEMVNRASPSKDQSEGKTLTVAGVSHSVEERGNGTAKKNTSAWKGGRGAGTAVKKAKRAMRRLQMMQKLKKQKESVRLNVLDTMDAIGFTARNFKHRARDIVNIANMAFLVVALGAIISVSYSSGRKSIDTSLSYLGIDQVERVQTKFSTMLDHTKGTINMLSYMTSRRSFLADALDDRTSALLYGALLSNPQFAHFEVDGLGAMRGDFTKVTDNARRTIYVWSTFANGSRAVRKSVDQGSTFTGAVIAEKGETLETSLFDMFPSCAGRGVTAENKSCVFSSLQGQPSNINKIRHTRLLHCCGLGDAGTTSVSLTIDTLGLNQTIVVDDAVQIANKFQETHADKSFRIVLYDESLGIVARSFNETGQTDAWCDGGIHDQFLRECYRRIYSFYGRICKLRLKSGAQQQCSESAVIAKDLMKGPLNGCLRASLESDQEQHIFKSRLGDSGVQLKLTYGQDSKLEAYRIFLDSIHPDVSGGLAVAFSEVAFQASFGHGMLVTIPVVSAFLLLMSFGCSHLSLSLLGYDAKSLKGVRLGADTQPQSSSLQYMRHALRIITTVASSAKSLVARWWLLLIIFSTIIAVINAHIMGRGWGISMLTCKRDVSWRAYQGATRALSTIFRVPVAWACWTQMWTSRCLEKIPTGTRGRCTYWCRQNHKTHQMSKRYWVGLIAATSIATVCEFFFGYLLDDDGVGYEQHGIGIYLLLEILTVLSYFAVLPFVCRRRYSTKRKTDIELVDGDVTLEHSNDRGSVSSVSSVGSLGELVAESAGRDDGNKTDEISLGVQSSTEYSGRRVRSASVTSKNLDYIEGWGFWSTAGVTVAIFMGIHVVVTALIEASSLTAKAGDLHALNPPQLTTSEVSRVLEVLWFAPLLVCMLLSMRQMPDAHSHTAFGLLSGFFSCLFPFILGRSFLFFLVWFKSDINGWFQFVSEFGLYICYMVFAALILECFRVMALVAVNEENVELAMAHCFVFQVFDCCFLNFMFIKLSPLSSTFLMIVVIRGFAAVARGSGQFVQIGYKLQERCGVMPDILKRPVLTLYTDLRWAHQSLVAEIISMSSVLVAILLEFMTNQCDSETGLVSEDLGSKDVFPVLTHEFSCSQTISLIVSNFIVLVVMIVALVFSTSIWHHKFKAMEKVMKHTLDAHRRLSVLNESARESNDSSVRSAIELVAGPAHTKTLDRTLSSLHRREERFKKLLTIPTKTVRLSSLSGKTDDMSDTFIGDSDTMSTERTNLKPATAGSARSLVKQRRSTMNEAQAIAAMASNRLKAMTHIRSDQTLWNLREAIDVHYGRHFFLYLVSTGYAVCYSMQTVVRVNEDLRDLSTQVTFSTTECSANTTSFG